MMIDTLTRAATRPEVDPANGPAPFRLLRAIDRPRASDIHIPSARRLAAVAVQQLYELRKLVDGDRDSDRAAAIIYAAISTVSEEGGPRLSVNRYARRAGLSRRTLSRRLSVVGLPTLSDWLRIGRIMRTLDLLAKYPQLTQSRAAHMTGWPDPFTFSNACKDATGKRPSELVGKLPVAVMLDWLETAAPARSDTAAPARSDIAP